jgi:hypothetical protein
MLPRMRALGCAADATNSEAKKTAPMQEIFLNLCKNAAGLFMLFRIGLSDPNY